MSSKLDISFTSSAAGLLEMPLSVTGACSGNRAAAQKAMAAVLSGYADPRGSGSDISSMLRPGRSTAPAASSDVKAWAVMALSKTSARALADIPDVVGLSVDSASAPSRDSLNLVLNIKMRDGGSVSAPVSLEAK